MAVTVGGVVIAVSEPARTVVAAGIMDPLALMAQRSPGERTPGALTQTKLNKRVAAGRRRHPSVPAERVLANVRFRPSTGFGPDAAPSDLPLDGPLGGEIPLGTIVDGNPLVPTSSEASFANTGLGGGVLSGPLTGGAVSSDTGGSTTTMDPGATIAGVPETATWAMMLVGLGAVGFAMRRRQKLATALSQ